MSMIDMKKLEKLLKDKHLRPSRTRHRMDGLADMVWFVDNDDDRFVELRGSVGSRDFLVLRRDGRDASASVVDSMEKAILLVEGELVLLGKIQGRTSP